MSANKLGDTGDSPLIPSIAGHSLFHQAMRRLVRNRLAVFGMFVVGVIAVAAIIGPALIYSATGYTYDYIPADSDLVKSFPPSWTHPMGTDNEGRDMLAGLEITYKRLHTTVNKLEKGKS